LDGEPPRWQPDRPLVVLPPLLLDDLIGVRDRGALAVVQRKARLLVLEEQPDLLERVPVVQRPQPHALARLLAAGAAQVPLLPAQRVLPVVTVGALRLSRVPVHGYPCGRPGDRSGT